MNRQWNSAQFCPFFGYSIFKNIEVKYKDSDTGDPKMYNSEPQNTSDLNDI